MTHPPLRGLYAITPDCNDTDLLLQKVTAALDGGVCWLQYRNKTASTAVQENQATALLELCRRRGARLIINDDLALTLAIGADGIHIGKDDADPTLTRTVLGPTKILGISCYDNLERAKNAARVGADYIAFGSLFPSPTKPNAPRAPIEILEQAKTELGLPVAAIGGITLKNAETVIEAGADLLAVITDLFDAPDIRARANAYHQLF